jgi:dihydrofolate synthase/folylpolyglutamate synthase
MLSKPEKYNRTVEYLYNLQKEGVKLGLENTKNLMNVLEDPQKTFRSIHIAGTNGKGSTAAIMASILVKSGFKVGLFTSPHLVSFTERIKINDRQIPCDDVIDLTSYVIETISETGIRPTFFEFVTAMAFFYFASKNIDWAVVETGMGGRFDATNVILPEISVITDIGLDHSEFLGSSISDITREKAGIIKPKVPVVTAARSPEATRKLSDTANFHGSDFHHYGDDFSGGIVSMDDRSITFNYSGYRSHKNMFLPLSGRHQLYNASMAIRVCEILCQKTVSVPDDAIRSGLLNLKLEGRLERVSEKPYIILDSAHNPMAASALADTIKELFPDKEIILVIGLMKDKDIDGILKPLIQSAMQIIFTKPEGQRAASPVELRERAVSIRKADIDISPPRMETAGTVAEALALAQKQWRQDSIILITGSFYTTGEAKELLGHTGFLSGLREELIKR